MIYKSPQHKTFLIRRRRKTILINSMRIGILIIFLALWEIASALGIIDSFIFSSPSRIAQTLSELYNDGSLFRHIGISAFETVIGFLSGTAIGFIIATVLWCSDSLRKIFEPYLVVLNSLPKIALGPIIIVWAGTGASSIILMAILISFVISALNMLTGFCETDPDKILLLRTMNANKSQIFFKLVLPASIPTLLSTLKINVGMAWVGTIMGEYLVSKAGLGYLIVYGSQVFNLDVVMTCTIVLCALAGIMYAIVALAEKIIVKAMNS